MTPSHDRQRSATLLGCGNIGFRHLQALCRSSLPAMITVVEPNADTHQRITRQFADAAASTHTFELLSALPERVDPVDLLIVTTTAEARRAAIENAVAAGVVRSALLEKVLFQTTGDLEAIGNLLTEHGVNTFVNCGRRTFGGYRTLRERWAGRGPVDVHVSGNRFGLGSNAVHFLDLAEFLNHSAISSIDASGLADGSVAGRRPGTVEVFGSLSAGLANGATLTVDCLDADPVRIIVTATCAGERAEIDELARTITDSDGTSASFDSQNVSETVEPYELLLGSRTCDLTPYSDSARQHRFYLDALRGHLGLSIQEDEPCPVT